MKKIGIFSLLLLLVFSACRKDIDEVTVTEEMPEIGPEYENRVIDVNASAFVSIIDENEAPVEAAEVFINGTTYQSNQYGHVLVPQQVLNAWGTLLQVRKDGFYNGSRRFFPTENSESKVVVQLIRQDAVANFDASEGEKVLVNGGAFIEFFPNTIQTAAGASYQGRVYVAAHWLNPTDPATLNQMPGSLQGLEAQNLDEVALATYGMLVVELSGDAGEALNIADGAEAIIEMPVPNSLLADAPTTIPLWSYNEELGLWVEESSATLEGDRYIGKVSHFSFWNCDVPFDLVNFELTLTDPNGMPIVNAWVVIENSNAASGSGWTNDEGIVSGKIPANEQLQLKVYGACDTEIVNQDIGPFSTDATLNITADDGTVETYNLSGALKDCDNEDIENGLFLIEYGGKSFYHYISAGDFQIPFTFCSGNQEITYRAIDLDDLVESSPETIQLNDNLDLGDIAVCSQTLENYLTVTMDGLTAIYLDPGVGINPSSGTYIGENWGGQGTDGLGIGFNGLTAGDYSGGEAYMNFILFNDYGWNFSTGNQFPWATSFIVTQYDATKLVGTATYKVVQPNTPDLKDVHIVFDLNL